MKNGSKILDEKLKCGALFSGIGGFCLGFETAGFETAWATDFDEQVAKTYRHNFSKTNFILNNIQQLDFNTLNQVDVIHAGFPCQSFSQAGNRKGFSDPRGKLFLTMMEKIREAIWKPKILVFENTSFLRNGSNGEWFEIIKNRLSPLDIGLTIKMLSSSPHVKSLACLKNANGYLW